MKVTCEYHNCTFKNSGGFGVTAVGKDVSSEFLAFIDEVNKNHALSCKYFQLLEILYWWIIRIK